MVLVEGVVGRGLLLLMLLQDEDDERADGRLVGNKKALQGRGTSKAARATTSKVCRRDMVPMRWWEWCSDVSERLQATSGRGGGRGRGGAENLPRLLCAHLKGRPKQRESNKGENSEQ